MRKEDTHMKISCMKANPQEGKKVRVAAYCRVSTKRAEQEDSLQMQQKVYKNRIFLRTDWELVDIYADALSGLSAEKRPDFMRMIAACMEGKIDRILCKSVSRFSRNLVECQRYTQLLLSRNIIVEFEKENIRTDDPTSSLMFSLMCSIAQNESRSISENIRMGYQARFKRGDYSLGNNRILGYDCVDRKLVPNEDAWIVKMAFELFLEGKTYEKIADVIHKAGAESLRKCATILPSTIFYILRNETYAGDKWLYKQPPRDFITHKRQWDSEYNSYYVKDDHESIVDRKTWDAVQRIHNQRQEQRKKGLDVRGRNAHFLFGKVKCGECGEYYTRRTFREHGKDDDGNPITYKAWVCKDKRKGKNGKGCHNHSIREDELLKAISDEMGWGAFDEKRFEEWLEVVIIKNDNTIMELIPKLDHPAAALAVSVQP